MSSESRPKFRVAICGAGIGGLVLAITIGKYDPSIPIDLYEAHQSIDTAGLGVAFWTQVHEVMIELGLFDDFKQVSIHDHENGHGSMFRRSDIPEGGYVWYRRPHYLAPSTAHRRHMMAALEKHLPTSCTVHTGKRLVNYLELEEHEAHSVSPIRLKFADGTTSTTDILIGADGIRSAVRKTLFETAASEDKDNGDEGVNFREYIDPIFSGMVTYRFLLSAERLAKENPENHSLKHLTTYSGTGRCIITYPIADGTLINVAASFIDDPSLIGKHYEGQWVTDTTRDEVIHRFDDFEPDAKAVLKLCENPSKWALHIVKPLPFCVRKRVALIGDACHAMTPHFGGGAGQAIDDAFVLGRLVAHPLTTLFRIPGVLRLYEQIRFPSAQHLMSISLSTGLMYMLMEPGYYDGTRKEEDLDEKGIGANERDGMESMKQVILQRWEWIDNSRSGVGKWEEAELELQALVEQVPNWSVLSD